MRLLFVGDCVINNTELFSVPKEIEINSYDYRICNLEAPIGCKKDTAFKKVGPHLCQSKAAIEAIKRVGFNICLLANNHIMDYGSAALERTIMCLDSKDIYHVGAGINYDAYIPLELNKNDENVVIINIAEAQFGVAKEDNIQAGYAWLGSSKVTKMIHEYKTKGYFVIVCCHAGLENYENPLPEWKKFYHQLVEFGANCIVASHPHVVQGFEIYKDSYIYYSLGNYFFDSISGSKNWRTGMIVSVDTVTQTCTHDYTFFDGKNISLLKDNSPYEYLNEIINDDLKMDKIADDISEITWNDYYGSYYECCINSKKKLMNKIFKKIGLHRKYDTVNKDFLLHNIQIETNRFVVERYLYNRNLLENNIYKNYDI